LSVQNVATPIPLLSEALIRVTSTSINPDDFDSLGAPGAQFTPGFDFAGEVASLNTLNIPLRFDVGDRVWSNHVDNATASRAMEKLGANPKGGRHVGRRRR
jgi:NADPH:quinone reductase-like Zn-dependent oxidoreductase